MKITGLCFVLFTWGSVLAQSTLTSSWQTLVDSLQTAREITGVLVHVDAPDHDISWTAAAGVADIRTGRPLTGHEPVRIASITKSFVATTIMRLWEDGRLSLADPISKFISKEHQQLLHAGGYHPEEMTIQHLLTHTSGLFDHGSSAEYMRRVLAAPQHQWTRTEQIAGSMSWGKPVGSPGERYSYSDTGYLLLGEVVETLTGQSLGIAIRALVDYDKIELNETWFEITESAPKSVAPRAHQYLDTIDTYGFNPSLDLYGGGGIVTTMADLTGFYRALFERRIYKGEATLDTMIAPVMRISTDIPNLDYRRGVWYQSINGYDAFSHSGFWGVQVWFLPGLNVGIAVAVIRQDDFAVVKEIMAAIVSDIARHGR